jgi:glycosyltransferase involved in cell wall biosynthesis
MSVSILILTLNEEANLAACLDSVRWFDDVVVLDSFSSDRTVEIASSYGARVAQRTFDDWASHQNWALDNITFKYPWVLYIDADERVTDELAEEVRAIGNDPCRPEVAFYCGRKNFFMGRWLRHAMPPGMVLRFFKPPFIRFERLVNPIPVIHGRHGYLTHHLLHYNFSKGLTEWIDKHNKYSQLEAVEGVKLAVRGWPAGPSLLARDPALRRRALKALSFRLPFRPLLKFFYLYVLNRGFLDGRPGFTYCLLQSVYEYMIVIKIKELQRRERGLPV